MNAAMTDERQMTRRALLKTTMGLAMLLVPGVVLGADGVSATRAAIAAVLGSKVPKEGGIKLITPPIAENGNTVPMSVSVESPFTEQNYFKAIHIFAEQNPSPDVISFFFTPACGKADVSSRIRLAKTQNVIAIALLSDGTALRTTKEVKVTIGGCGG